MIDSIRVFGVRLLPIMDVILDCGKTFSFVGIVLDCGNLLALLSVVPGMMMRMILICILVLSLVFVSAC